MRAKKLQRGLASSEDPDDGIEAAVEGPSTGALFSHVLLHCLQCTACLRMYVNALPLPGKTEINKLSRYGKFALIHYVGSNGCSFGGQGKVGWGSGGGWRLGWRVKDAILDLVHF